MYMHYIMEKKSKSSQRYSTLKPLNFTSDLILLILKVMKIHKIKYLQKFKFTLTVRVKLPDLQN